MGCYSDAGVECERVRWPNPPPSKRYSYIDVLESIKVPEWVSESERGGDANVEGKKEECGEEGFAIF